MNRRQREDEQGTTDYAYDRSGNRTFAGAQNTSGQWTAPYQTLSYETPTTGGPSQRLSEVRDAGGNALDALVYDANGNPRLWQHPGLRVLNWDALDRLVSIAGNFIAQYRYDPLGRRIEKTELGETLRYQYDGLDVVAEYSVTPGGASTLAASYVFGPGIDEPIKIRRGATTAAYHSDGLGSILAASSISTSGSTDLLTYRYDAFGVIEASTGTLDSTYTYTGRELDASGLYYYRARYYLPSAGRFLSPDPIGLAGGLNAYAYVGSNPVNYTDPFGLISMTPKPFSNLMRGAPPQAPAFQSQGADFSLSGLAQSAGYRVGSVLEQTGSVRTQYDLFTGTLARTVEGSFLRDQAVMNARNALPPESRALNQFLFPIEEKLAQGSGVRARIEAGAYPRIGALQNASPGVSAVSGAFRVAGRTILSASVAYGAYSVYAASPGQRRGVAIREAGGLGGALAGGFLGAETGLLCGPGAFICSPALAVGGAVAGGIAGEEIVGRLIGGAR